MNWNIDRKAGRLQEVRDQVPLDDLGVDGAHLVDRGGEGGAAGGEGGGRAGDGGGGGGGGGGGRGEEERTEQELKHLLFQCLISSKPSHSAV